MNDTPVDRNWCVSVILFVVLDDWSFQPGIHVFCDSDAYWASRLSNIHLLAYSAYYFVDDVLRPAQIPSFFHREVTYIAGFTTVETFLWWCENPFQRFAGVKPHANFTLQPSSSDQ